MRAARQHTSKCKGLGPMRLGRKLFQPKHVPVSQLCRHKSSRHTGVLASPVLVVLIQYMRSFPFEPSARRALTGCITSVAPTVRASPDPLLFSSCKSTDPLLECIDPEVHCMIGTVSLP